MYCVQQAGMAPKVQTQGGESAFTTALLLYKKITKLKMQNNLIGRAGEQNTQHGMREIATQTNKNIGLEYTEGAISKWETEGKHSWEKNQT